ncbi:CidA/LrgA family protein [Halomonas sp. YLGW01]|uniref:CidA/LrgA family protein n=1 Tax=Halomonas sp. YLGW01 TaxID=2773308 RepID=UPI001780124C|nr:CidA/LrgA family protein [Halomonas sp. YLGW01]
MAVLRGFLWLTAFWLAGRTLVVLLDLPISAGVVGMLLMTAMLMLRGGRLSDIAAASQPLIGLLAMLIMPGVVGVFFVADEFAGQWLAVAVALVGGTLASVLTTLLLMRRCIPAEPTANTPDETPS